MMASKKELEKQIEFISDLTNRLKNDIHSNASSSYSIADYMPSRIKADVMRIRRELNTLSKMTEWSWQNDNR